MGCALIVICFKLSGESLQPFQRFRRIFRQDLCVLWRKVSSKSSCSNHETLLLDLTIWVVVCGLLRWEEKLKGFFGELFVYLLWKIHILSILKRFVQVWFAAYHHLQTKSLGKTEYRQPLWQWFQLLQTVPEMLLSFLFVGLIGLHISF